MAQLSKKRTGTLAVRVPEASVVLQRINVWSLWGDDLQGYCPLN